MELQTSFCEERISYGLASSACLIVGEVFVINQVYELGYMERE